MPHHPTVASLATAWGPRHGGINAFNIELVKSLGILPGRGYGLICVVLDASEAEHEDARNCGVELVPLGVDGDKFPDDADVRLANSLAERGPGEAWVWLGHDTVSGGLALQLRERFAGSKVALIHHMAFGAYVDFKKLSSQEAAAKREQQRTLFSQADLCLAVGPMLRDQLEDLLGADAKVEMLVPGLAQPAEVNEQAPNNFTAFVAGRLGMEDDRIKQGALAVRAYGQALAKAFSKETYKNCPIRKSPSLRMRGVPDVAQAPVRKLLGEAGGRVVNCDLAPFGEDRDAYFRDLAGSSVAMMPSWHDGFGLVAWEAIACAVPVVIGEQSGVHRLLQERQISLHQSVRGVAVQGHLPEDADEPNHSDADVEAVRDALFDLGDHIHQYKQDAVALATILRREHDYTWPRCARDLLVAMAPHLGLDFGKPDTVATAPIPPHPAPPAPPDDLPAFLRPPRPRPWRPDSGQAISALLVARDQIVPFDSERNAVVESWLAWAAAAETPRIALRLITGPGGMGKTRSAIECLQRARARGWQALWLAGELPDDWLAQWRDWLHGPQATNAPCLLVIDYIEGRQEALLHLLDRALAVAADTGSITALRLLLLARTATWWPELTRHTACSPDVAALLTGSANAGVEELRPWDATTTTREQTYLAALQAYAAAQGLVLPTHPYRPDFSATMYARPLHLHLAALAALAGERPEHAAALLDSQLRREWRYWRQSRLAPAASYDDWGDALAWLALVQGASRHQTQAALTGLGIAAPGLVDGLARAYPDGPANITPLQPDPLAEALLLERLASRRGEALAGQALAEDATLADQALEVIGRLAGRLQADGSADAGPLWQRQLSQGLASAWPQHGEAMLNAAHAMGTNLGRLLLSAWQRLPAAERQTLAATLALPDYSTPLLALSVAIERARLDTATEPAERAGILNDLSIRLSYLGDAASRAEALDCAREAVAIRRELAQAQPAAYRPNLALSLNNLANRLSERGDAESRAEALDCAREAVALDCAREAVAVYRELAQAQPAAYRPNLAGSLNNLAAHLSEQGDAASRAEALDCAREAVAVYRELAQAQPAAYRPDLAMSLNNLAAHLSEQGDAASRAEALDCAREAVAVYRELAQAQPAAYRPNLALSLNNLANRLSERGDAESRAEALDCAREAVAIRRELAQAQPAAYRPDLAESLNNLANHLSEQGDAASRAEALVCACAAVQIYAECHAQMPHAFERNLSIATRTLSHVADALGTDPQQALEDYMSRITNT